MVTCTFCGYLSTNTFYQNIPQLFGKIPQNTGKVPANAIISSKKHAKILDKRLLLELNRSWRPIPGRWKFQNHNMGQ